MYSREVNGRDEILDDVSDEELVIRFQSGEPFVFEELRNRYISYTVGIIREFVQNNASVDDVNQIVWLEAAQHIGTIRNGAMFKSWIGSVAANRGRNRARDEGRRLDSVQLDADESSGSQTVFAVSDAREVLPLQKIVASERAVMVRDAIARLNANERAAIEAFYDEGMKIREVADHLGISESAAKSQIQRARSSLRLMLSRMDSDFDSSEEIAL